LPPREVHGTMFNAVLPFFSLIQEVFQTRTAIEAEILALRHQLLAPQLSDRGHRFRLERLDRFLWLWPSGFWSGWRSALPIGVVMTLLYVARRVPGLREMGPSMVLEAILEGRKTPCSCTGEKQRANFGSANICGEGQEIPHHTIIFPCRSAGQSVDLYSRYRLHTSLHSELPSPLA
jgi:hypothetical protein